MLSFLSFERRRIFRDKKNLIILGFISLLGAYFTWSGVNEYRQFQKEKQIFVRFEKEKIAQIVNYSQYGVFGFRLLFEASPLNIFFVNSSVLQNVESNIDSLEAIKVESSFKGKSLFLKRGYFKDFAGIPFIFGSLLMLYMGHLALVSPVYLRFISGRMSLRRMYAMTTAARLFWLDLFFIGLGLVLFALVRFWGVAFSRGDKAKFLWFLLFLVLLMDFFYMLGQFTAVLLRFRRVFFIWLFVVWFVCVFLMPELDRIGVFNRSQVLESAEEVNLEKFRTVMALEKKFRDYLKANPATPMDQIRQMQKKFAVQYMNSSFLINSGLETKYLREVEGVISRHERQSLLFPTTFYQFLAGEISGKGYYGYLDFMEYILTLRNRFMQFYLKKRYEGSDSASVESFVKGDENIFRSSGRLPGTFWFGSSATLLYCLALFALSFWRLRRLVPQS